MNWVSHHRWSVTLALCASAVAVVAAWWLLVLPGPLAFAGGHAVDLAEYKDRSPAGVPAELASADLVTRGRYLANATDCMACHTAKGGKPFAGGRPFTLPFGTLYTPNITSDRETGIGAWTDAEFVRAVHKGVSRDGSRLYPAFPYASYTMLTDEDVLAIRAYLATVPPIRQSNIANTFAFPFNQRWLMLFWGAFYNGDQRFRPIAERSAEWNRGAYLVEAAAHCGECHTPRNLMQAMDTRSKFAGGVAEGWNAYNISADPAGGVGKWSSEALTDYLARGFANGHGSASGPMGEAVRLSLSKLAATDIMAMVAYLQTVPAIPSATFKAALPRSESPLGKQMFEGSCASCHSWTGQGSLIGKAQLIGDRAVDDPTAVNVVRMVLNGSGTQANGEIYMPGFAHAYSDAEIAAVANYVTSHFGSRPSHLTTQDVSGLRAR